MLHTRNLTLLNVVSSKVGLSSLLSHPHRRDNERYHQRRMVDSPQGRGPNHLCESPSYWGEWNNLRAPMEVSLNEDSISGGGTTFRSRNFIRQHDPTAWLSLYVYNCSLPAGRPAEARMHQRTACIKTKDLWSGCTFGPFWSTRHATIRGVDRRTFNIMYSYIAWQCTMHQ